MYQILKAESEYSENAFFRGIFGQFKGEDRIFYKKYLKILDQRPKQPPYTKFQRLKVNTAKMPFLGVVLPNLRVKPQFLIEKTPIFVISGPNGLVLLSLGLSRFDLVGFFGSLITNIEVFFIKNRGFTLKSTKTLPKKGYFCYFCSGFSQILSKGAFWVADHEYWAIFMRNRGFTLKSTILILFL